MGHFWVPGKVCYGSSTIVRDPGYISLPFCYLENAASISGYKVAFPAPFLT